MKGLILGLCLMFLSSVAFAAPYVITGTHNPALVENYVVTLDGGNEVTVSPIPVEGGVVGAYDVGGLPEGSHTVTIKTSNMWGESAAVPLQFDVNLPPTVTDIQLVRELP